MVLRSSDISTSFSVNLNSNPSASLSSFFTAAALRMLGDGCHEGGGGEGGRGMGGGKGWEGEERAGGRGGKEENERRLSNTYIMKVVTLYTAWIKTKGD